MERGVVGVARMETSESARACARPVQRNASPFRDSQWPRIDPRDGSDDPRDTGSEEWHSPAVRSLGALATGVDDGRWHLDVGDPTWVAWLTVATYAVAAWLCLRAARALRGTAPTARRVALFWLLLGVLLVALGANKQLDLQTPFINALRDLAHEQGWYRERRLYQRWFVGALGAVSVLGLVALGVGLWPVRQRVRLALVGFCGLLGFVLMRAALFQGVGPDWLARSAPAHPFVELLSVGLLAWAASRARPAP
jgi:hypothetical protein